MAVSRSPAPLRARHASVDSRERERESRAAVGREDKEESLRNSISNENGSKRSGDRFWCGCMGRPSAVSPPLTVRRSTLKHSDVRRAASDLDRDRESKSQASLASSEFRSDNNLLRTGDPRSADLRPLCENRPLELKAGEIAIAKKFTTLAEGLELRPTSPFRPRLSPGKVSPLMDQSLSEGATNSLSAVPQPPSFTSFNNLRGGLASPPVDRVKGATASPTLFEMMAHDLEAGGVPRSSFFHPQSLISAAAASSAGQPSAPNDKCSAMLGGSSSPGNQFNDSVSSDLKLTLTSKDGYSVTVSVHRHILVANSRFFGAKLSDRWSKQQRALPHLVEISDCEDVELYLETLRLMYTCDMKRNLMKETVVRVLGILKVSAAIVFEAGVVACLEFLEAVPWAEDEEDKVLSLLSQLQLESVGAGDVLQRCVVVESTNSEDILVRLLDSVIKGTDEKARREMKALLSRVLRENMSQSKEHFNLSKESLYRASHSCLDSLLRFFMQATSADFTRKNTDDRGSLIASIARQADNLHWLVDILIDRRIADDLVRMWANQSELATLHMQVPIMYRYEVSRLTARFCIAIGKGQVVISKDVRYMLLQTWLQPLVEDFGWMQRCCKVLDKKVVEEGISQTILTLPLKQQQVILLAWFDRFSNAGDDCPNLQKAFEVWWRRMFVKSNLEDESPSSSNADISCRFLPL